MHWTIRRKLTALVLVVLLPLLAGVLAEFWGEMRGARERADEELHTTAQAVARRLDEALTAMIQTLDALPALRGLDRLTDADLAAFAARLRVAHPFVRVLFTMGPDGRLLATSGAVPAAASLVHRVDVHAVVQARDVVVSPPRPGSGSPERAVTLLVPALDRQGQTLGVVAAEIDPAALSLFLEGVPPGRGGGISVTTAAGGLLAGAGTGARSAGALTAASGGLLTLVRQRGGAAEWRGEDGQTLLGAAVPLRRPDWVVVATMPWEPVASAARARLAGDLRWAALAALVALLIASVISRQMNRSVQALIAGTRSLVEGEGAPVSVETRDELAELAERFNRSVEDRRVARAAAEARQRRLEALAEVNLALSRELDVDVVARQVVEQVRGLLGAHSSALFRLDPGSGTLVALAVTGATGRSFAPGLVFPRGSAAAGLAVETASPVASRNVLTDPRIHLTAEMRAAIEDSAHRSVLAVPLAARGTVIGALSIGDADGREFDADETGLLQTFAAQAALALDNARLLEETRRSLRQLEETQAQLVQAAKLSAVGQLVSGVAHELNNPLSVVMGHGQLLLSKQPLPEVRRPVEQIVAQAARMAKIIQGLLLFARQRKRTHEPVAIQRVVEQTLALRADQLRLSGIEVEVEHPADMPRTAGDAHQLQQVFLNLLLNAEQAIGGAGGRIRIRSAVSADSAPPRLRVEVSDDGPGIPPEVLPRIFDPFFTTKDVGKGTGLGLSVSHGIIEQHGGRLWAESRPGHTVFTVELPVMAERSPGPAAPPAPALGAVGGGRRALVVDDEPLIVDFVTALLRHAGWEVDVCGGGRAALDRVRTAHYDLIVSDLRMAEGSGEEFHRTITAERPALARRFLCITGDTANPEAWKFLRAVGVPVLEKPFSADALLRAVEELTA